MAFPVTIGRHGAVFEGKHTLWVQCPDCGPRPPLVEWNGKREQWYTVNPIREAGFFSPGPRFLVCLACGKDAPYKKVVQPRNGTGKVLHCDRRCLDAKGDDCNCMACMGRCHGESICYCADAKQ